MSIIVYFVDLSSADSRLEKIVMEKESGLTAFGALERALGLPLAKKIESDFASNSRAIMVSWWNKETDEHSEYGGVGAIDWEIDDHSVLTVNYESETTTEQQINDSIEWMLTHEP